MKFGEVKQTVLIEASPDEVYEAFVDPKKHSAFTGQGATGRPRVGGRFTAGDEYISGKFLVLEKGKRILQEWMTTEWPKGYPPSHLELRLRAKGKKTELTMVHSKVPEEQVDYYAGGWMEWYWEPLKKYFAKV